MSFLSMSDKCASVSKENGIISNMKLELSILSPRFSETSVSSSELTPLSSSSEISLSPYFSKTPCVEKIYNPFIPLKSFNMLDWFIPETTKGVFDGFDVDDPFKPIRLLDEFKLIKNDNRVLVLMDQFSKKFVTTSIGELKSLMEKWIRFFNVNSILMVYNYNSTAIKLNNYFLKIEQADFNYNNEILKINVFNFLLYGIKFPIVKTSSVHSVCCTLCGKKELRITCGKCHLKYCSMKCRYSDSCHDIECCE